LVAVPDPGFGLAPWAAVWAHVAEWTALVKLALHRAALESERSIEALSSVEAFRKLLASGVPVADPDEYLCAECRRWFSSLAGLGQHVRMAHQASAACLKTRSILAGSVCPDCGTDFRSRIRAVRHLVHGARRCVVLCQSGSMAPLPIAVVEEADAVDRLARARRRSAGYRDHAGPPVVAGVEAAAAG
jgi:hypothetical protein